MSVLFICGGTVIDPETLRKTPADVLCNGTQIERICPPGTSAPPDAVVVDASGCYVCPGFIDPHGHIDGCVHTGILSLLQASPPQSGETVGFRRWTSALF